MSKFHSFAILCVIALTFGISTLAVAQQPITPFFFGMSMTGGEVGGEPWPVDNFSGARLWDSGSVAWSQLNPAPGVYDWRQLNIWMNKAQQNGIDLNYCIGRTPTWASVHPKDKTCGNEPGSCDAPDDINVDGTGTDQHFKDFITALATHSAGRIHYWELWDEFPNPYRWNWKIKNPQNTMPQLVRMAKDARTIIKSIDPTAVIISDSGALRFNPDVTKWQQFVQAGGLNYADVVAMHGYTQPAGNGLPEPETLVGLLQGSSQLPWGPTGFYGFLQQSGYGGLPVWDTEGSWAGNIAGLNDPDMRAGFAIRFNLMHLYMNVQRFYWYEWDNTFAGTLWQPYTRFDVAVPNSNGNVVSMLGFGDGSFQEPVGHGVGSTPVAVAVGDFNNDGIADIMVANQNSNDVTVLLGNGDGTFKAGINSNAGNSPVAVAVGDFTKNGKLDVVVVNGGSSNSVSVLMGNGDGTFQSPLSYNVGSNPSAVAVGDFNQDGYPDLAVADGGSGTVSVLLNNQNGGFGQATNYAVGNGPSSVAAADFNNDGYPDLAVANATDGTVSVLLNNKNGTFGTATPYTAHSNPSSVAAGYIASSKNISLVVANQGSNDVSLLIGNGSGTFAAAVNYPTGSQPVSIAVADFNGDGLLDVATANKGDNTMTTLLDCGLGKQCKGNFFRPPKATGVGSNPLALAIGAFSVIGNKDPGTLEKGGFGYQASYNWTAAIQSTMTGCSGPQYPNHGVWTCNFTGPGGYQAQAVWDSSQSCSNNICTYSNYASPQGYVQYRTAYGQVIQIQNNNVQIGYVPILLENHNPHRAMREIAHYGLRRAKAATGK